MAETNQDEMWDEAKRIESALTQLEVDMWNLINMSEDESLRAEFSGVTFRLKETRNCLEAIIEVEEGTADWIKLGVNQDKDQPND